MPLPQMGHLSPSLTAASEYTGLTLPPLLEVVLPLLFFAVDPRLLSLLEDGAAFTSADTLLPEESDCTSLMILTSWACSSSIKYSRVNVPFSMSRNFFSHWPVSSGLFSILAVMILIRSLPAWQETRFFFSRLIYPRFRSVSMIPARLDGRPMPFSFIASRSVSSSTSFPAVSID